MSREAKPPFRLADRLALRPPEAAATLGICERTFRSLLPSIPHVREGDGAVLIPVDLLREWLRSKASNRERKLEALERELTAAIGDDSD